MVLDNGMVLNDSNGIEQQHRSCKIAASTIMQQQNQNTSCISNMYTFFILKRGQH